MAHCDDALSKPVPVSPVQFTSSNFGSPNGSGSDLDGGCAAAPVPQWKSSEICWDRLCGDSPISKIMSRPSVVLWASSLPGSPMSNRSSVPFIPRWSHSKRWNRMSAPSLHACAISKQVQFPPQVSGVRFVQGLSSPVLFVHVEWDIKLLVHGDDSC